MRRQMRCVLQMNQELPIYRKWIFSFNVINDTIGMQISSFNLWNHLMVCQNFYYKFIHWHFMPMKNHFPSNVYTSSYNIFIKHLCKYWWHFVSHKTTDPNLQFIHPALIQCVTSSSISSFPCLIDPWYLKLSLLEMTWVSI